MSDGGALRAVAAAMIAMAAVMGFGRFVFTPILPSMMAQIPLSASEAGWIAGANYAGYLAGAVAAGGAWAAGIERRVMLSMMVLTALLLPAMAISDSVPVFMLIRFAAGVASALANVFLTATIFTYLAGIGRSDMQMMHFGGVGIGIAVSALIVGATSATSWTMPWIWSGLSVLVSLIVVARIYPYTRPASQGVSRAEPPLPRTTAVYAIVLSFGLFGIGYVITATFLIAIVRATAAGGHLETYVWLVTGLAGIPSVYLLMTLAKRTGLIAAYVIGALVEAVGVVASVVVGGATSMLVAGALFGATFLSVTAIGMQIARELTPRSPRRIVALMTASFGIGQMVGPPIAGFFADQTGDFFLPSIGAGLFLVLSGVAAMFAKARETPS